MMSIYCLSLFSYWHFYSDYEDKTCDNLLTCVIVNIDQTFKNDGGIGGFLNDSYDFDIDKNESSVSYARIIFDNVFNFIIMMLIVELLAGIIIDKFSELRENNE